MEKLENKNKGAATILVIEDEEMVMEVSRSILEALGYNVIEAENGEEAVRIARTFEGNIDLAILDVILPDMGGKEVYPLLMQARPDLKVIVCSGYNLDGPARDILNSGAQGFVQKPFSVANLSENVRKLLAEE